MSYRSASPGAYDASGLRFCGVIRVHYRLTSNTTSCLKQDKIFGGTRSWLSVVPKSSTGNPVRFHEGCKPAMQSLRASAMTGSLGFKSAIAVPAS